MGVKLGKKRGGRVRGHAVMSDINVTPMVDVMLVLLVIFMITAPLLTAGVAVDLPKAQTKAMGQQDNSPLEIAVDAKGNVYMGETRMTIERLKAVLSAVAKENVERRVYIRADHRLSYGQVMFVMGAVSSTGFTKVALVTDPGTAQRK